MEDNAFKGQPLDSKTLIYGLSRNNATLFTKYSEYCFNLSALHEGLNQSVDNCLHWKFYGTIIVEILKSNKEDSTLLFNLLPFIT